MRALITGAPDARGALAGARALHVAGWTVGVASPGGRGLAAASRAVTRRHDVPPPQAGAEMFAAGIRAAVSAGGYEVVFAAGDAELVALSERRDAFEAVVPHAPHAAVLRALDKAELTRAAAAAGLGVPRTWQPGAAAADGYAGPVVVKPRLHAAGGAARHEAQLADSVGEGERLAADLARAGAEPVLQERVIGRLIALTGVVAAGGREATGEDAGAPGAERTGAPARLLAPVQQMAERTWPLGAGVTACGRTVPVDADLLAGVEALLADLGWIGLAEVQFLDPGDGRPRLIDLNGRFYGSLALAVAAGCNLPAIWAAVATGRDAPAARARPGVRYQWLEGDLRAALASPQRARGVAAVLRRAPAAAHSVWSVRDPLPAVRYAAGAPARLRRRA